MNILLFVFGKATIIADFAVIFSVAGLMISLIVVLPYALQRVVPIGYTTT